MSEAQSIRAINRLFEDESVRSELTDVEANLVLGWGEAQLSQWAARGLPDETFDPLSYQFARLLGAVNSYIGKRKSLRPEAQRSRLHEVGTLARTCGYKISPAELDQFIGHQSALGNQEAISELLGLLKPGGEIDLPPAPAPAVVSE
ncbi:MAG: hypothetical protein JNJ78_17720, partial [Anaerolineae bacterium]|nr:hypothetical protein [Anaerolineae bacterium]